jgi:serine/threonine-protein kinase
MATVYLAHDPRHDRQVAIKVLKPELAAVLGADRFVQEIKTTAALQHPHILPLFDSGTADGFLYYVMPFIDGETLRTRLNRETQLGIEEAVRITTQVADALDYAHRHGVIHRDIKPENILLHDGRPMVADFGIALAVSAAAGGRMTETGLSLGTPHYMSPEQATAEKDLTNRSDIYSLGSVLYEMLTGNPPHTGASAQQIIMKIVTEEVAPVTRLRRNVPPNVAAAVGKALEKLSADRFETARAFAEALGNPAFVASTTAHRGSRGGAIEGPWKRRTMVASAAALLLLVPAIRGWLRPAPGGGVTRPWRVRITLPDSAPLGEGLALSSNGSALVYDGGGRLWMRTADATDPVPVAGGNGGTYPALSPDGRQLAFLRQNRSAVELVVLSLEGGAPKTVVSNVPLGTGIGWTDSGHIVYSGLGGLIRVPVAGDDGKPLTTIDSAAGEVFHLDASGLPGGGVVFTIGMRNSEGSIIAVVGPKGGQVTRLVPGIVTVYAPPDHLIVTRGDGSIVAVPFDVRRRVVTGSPVSIASGLRTGSFTTMGRTAVSASGRLIYVAGGWGQRQDPTDLVWTSRDGVSIPVDTSWAGVFQSVAIAPDGRRAAVGVAGDRSEDLLVRDLSSGSETRIAIPGTILRDPVFSWDGRQLYFVGLGSSHGVHRVDLGGTAPLERVVASEFVQIGQPAIARDGDQLYYVKAVAGSRQIIRYSLSDRTSDVAVVPGGYASRPQPSPDGRWLAFLSAATGNPEIHVRSTDAARSEDWRISPSADRGTSIRWSHAGNELFFVDHDSMTAVRVSLSPSFEVGTARALFPITGRKPVFDLSPDGSFLMIRWRPGLRPPTELVMLERWTDLLPR